MQHPLRASVCALLLVLQAPNAAATPQDPTVLVLGDSLTAGFGLSARDAFPAQLQRALSKAGRSVKMLNAGVSGDTTAGGLARVDWALSDKPDLVIVELGANDMLRGLDAGLAERNLDAIIRKLKAAKVRVLLAGMRAAPNLGPKYVKQFDGMYGRLAKKHGITLYPFFLEGVAMRPHLNQADGIHPTAEGIAHIVKRILPTVQAELGIGVPEETQLTQSAWRHRRPLEYSAPRCEPLACRYCFAAPPR